MRETILGLPPLPGGQARLSGWLARPGQAVRRGQPLCRVEQDGRFLDIPASRAGVVGRLLAETAMKLPPGAPLVAMREADAAWLGDVATQGGSLRVRRWPAPGAPRGACLLLHGFGGGLDIWATTAAGLCAEGFLAVAPDLPCHGATRIDATTPGAMARMLLAAWDDLGLTDPVHVIGHSMGGAVGLLLAAARPARIASLTLIAPLGLGEAVNGGFLADVLAAGDVASLAAALRPLTRRAMPADATGLGTMLNALDRHRPALGRLAAALADGDRQRLDLRATLADLPVPARLIVGADDAVLPWADVTPPPHVPLHILPCGHMPHWELPGVMRRVLAQSDWQAQPHRSGAL